MIYLGWFLIAAIIAYFIFRLRWYANNYISFFKTLSLGLYIQAREDELVELKKTSSFWNILLEFYNWDFISYVIHQREYLEACSIFFTVIDLQLSGVENPVEHLRSKATKDKQD